MSRLLFIVLASGVLHTAAQPSGLLVSFKPPPSLSVPLSPQFSWVVPASPTTPDSTQVAFRIVVVPAFGGGAPTWDSGHVTSNASLAVPYGGSALRGGRPYNFSVAVWLSDGTATAPAAGSFTTALGTEDWAPGAAFVWSPNASGVFALLRSEVRLAPSAVALALLHASAQTGDDTILCGYKVFIEGALVGVGPGRGEAPIWGGDGGFRSLPYASYDVTEAVGAFARAGSAFTLSAAGVGAWFSATRGILLQLDVHRADGSMESFATGGSAAPFSALHADGYLVPVAPREPLQTAYRHRLEFTDAREEPVGWQGVGFPGAAAWPRANATLPVAEGGGAAALALTPKMAANVRATAAEAGGAPPVPIAAITPTLGLVDFGREFEGGLQLRVGPRALAGETVTLILGESHAMGHVGSTWGYNFTWTLRGGAQTIEQLQYAEFRFVNVVLQQPAGGGGGGLAFEDLELRAWRVEQEWDEAASAFSSTNATLDAVWELSRWTLRAGLLDTYTDSNTRERRPYECDGLIAAAGRLLVQGDVAWVRHSHSYVLAHPTWPIEWQQMTALLAWQDYWATGSADFTAAYLDTLTRFTHISMKDGTGLLQCTGRHIVDWDPWPTREQFHTSQHLSVTQFFALKGLRTLSVLARAAGRSAAADALAAQAGSLEDAILAQLFNATTGLFCDGVCADPKVDNFASTFSSAWALFLGAAASAGAGAPAAAFERIARNGLEGYGDYGAFMYLSALAAYPDGDDGTALLTALTKGDSTGWVAEMRDFNATMTRESWKDPTCTYSHAWGTSPIGAVVNGIMGVAQTAPAWGAFTVKPRLGGVEAASLTLPTLRGPIQVNASAHATALQVPCGTLAVLCAPLPRAGGGGGGGGGRCACCWMAQSLRGARCSPPTMHAWRGWGAARRAPRAWWRPWWMPPRAPSIFFFVRDKKVPLPLAKARGHWHTPPCGSGSLIFGEPEANKYERRRWWRWWWRVCCRSRRHRWW